MNHRPAVQLAFIALPVFMTGPVFPIKLVLAMGLVPVMGVVVGCSDASDEARLSRDELLDPNACKDCHPAQFKEWSGSMHAYAAEDPVFIAMNTRGQRETKGELGDFCVKCHAPMAVREGLTTDGLNLAELPSKFRGITCIFCHSAIAVTGLHNAPITLAVDGTMRGGLAAPLATHAHGNQYSTLHDGGHLDSSKLCGSCHDIVLPNDVHLERTFKEWRETLFSQPVLGTQSSCNACHMHKSFGKAAHVPGATARRLHAHDFPGVDIAITDFPERATQRKHVQADLDPTVLAQLCVEITETTATRVEVMLHNVGAGHSFPSGASQDRRAWIELVAKSGGVTIHQSGVVTDDEPIAHSEDEDLWLLRDRGYDAKYNEVHMFWEVEKLITDLLPGPPIAGEGKTAGEKAVDSETRRIRSYMLPAKPDEVTIRLRIRPIGLEVLASLVKSKDLAAKHVAAMPTFDLQGTVLKWTAANAKKKITPTGRTALCVPKLLVDGADDPLAGADSYKPGMSRQTKNGKFEVSILSAKPTPPAEGLNTWQIKLVGADGQPVTGASIEAGTWMPEHHHGSPIIGKSTELGSGVYRIAPIELFMPGLWEITLGATVGTIDDKVVFRFWAPE